MLDWASKGELILIKQAYPLVVVDREQFVFLMCSG